MPKLYHVENPTAQSQADTTQRSPDQLSFEGGHTRLLASEEAAARRRPNIQIDIAKYQRMIDDPRLTEKEREKVIQSVWALLMAMVDLGLVLETQPKKLSTKS